MSHTCEVAHSCILLRAMLREFTVRSYEDHDLTSEFTVLRTVTSQTFLRGLQVHVESYIEVAVVGQALRSHNIYFTWTVAVWSIIAVFADICLYEQMRSIAPGTAYSLETKHAVDSCWQYYCP